MKDYKVIQKIYNSQTRFDDLLEEHQIVIQDDIEKIVGWGANYFQQDMKELIYPAKSYSVAIIYSYLISQNFGEDFFTSLNDPDLFCGNDKYFTPYQNNKLVYDRILSKIAFRKDFRLNTELLQINTTVNCFKKEFGLI